MTSHVEEPRMLRKSPSPKVIYIAYSEIMEW